MARNEIMYGLDKDRLELLLLEKLNRIRRPLILTVKGPDFSNDIHCNVIGVIITNIEWEDDPEKENFSFKGYIESDPFGHNYYVTGHLNSSTGKSWIEPVETPP
jgi:hypothetical protein